MDSIFEEIIEQTERQDFKESQQRVSIAKFIGEAYNHSLIHTDTLFCLLYRLINYDITTRQPDTYFQNLDQDKVDSFRIRLVCTILDTISITFQKGQR